MEPYSITSETNEGIEVFTLYEDGGTSLSVAPALGNTCFSFQTGQPVLEPVPFETFRQRPTSYGIPILFPFPNRIRDGEFSFRGKRYLVNPNRHGFVRDKPWSVLETGASEHYGAWITSRLDALDFPDEILRQFPFPFRLEVTYRLKDGTLEMETTVCNTGVEEMPFGFGIHPYFRRPAEGSITVPANKRWELVDSLPTGKLLPAEGEYDLREPRNITRVALDDIFTDIATDANRLARCSITDQLLGTRTIIECDAGQFPNVVVYTPPAPRQAICIEPYTCPTDALNLQNRGIESNVLTLQPKSHVDFRVRIYIE